MPTGHGIQKKRLCSERLEAILGDSGKVESQIDIGILSHPEIFRLDEIRSRFRIKEWDELLVEKSKSKRYWVHKPVWHCSSYDKKEADDFPQFIIGKELTSARKIGGSNKKTTRVLLLGSRARASKNGN